ncbi:hypothetical protein D2E26_0243 [Bifidobacterium dolichotidis]|uniref:DUF3267 domain-containing protein n=1 Tax=Bifidobacterium dolichotidis TaxID=2306976 RepID=A0A430FS44_9BIFI|nr:hypothetical protein [Bifidobacterium dolichotidis]RSX55680.1 hypothetical protein D2E26_0243 [Bifidobacterium dolichotidis]
MTVSTQSIRATLLRVAGHCYLPFFPLLVLGTVFQCSPYANPFVSQLLVVAALMPTCTVLHEYAHIAVLRYRNPQLQVSIVQQLFSIAVLPTPATGQPITVLKTIVCAVTGPAVGAGLAALCAQLAHLPLMWLVVVQQILCLIPPCDDGKILVQSIAALKNVKVCP